MTSVDEILHMGLAHHQAGRLHEAEQAYRRALAANENLAEAQNNLGTILQARGDVAGAIDCYRKAVAASPRFADAHNNLGTAYQDLGELDAAADCYRHAVEIEPGYAKGYYNLGALRVTQNKLAEAGAALERAIAAEPGYAEAHYGLALTLAIRRDFAGAEVEYQQALRLRPDWPDAQIALGNVYRQQEKTAQAIACYRRALALNPNHAEAHNSLGLARQHEGHLEQAIECYRQAALAAPDASGPYTNWGNALFELGRLDEALVMYERSLSRSGDVAQTHLNRALVHLSRGRFAEGWAEFAWRLECDDHPRRVFEAPLWDGTSFAGRTLLVHAEQGLGDTLQFVRYLPQVRRQGGQVVLEVQGALVPLLACSGFPEAVAAGTPLPPFDVHLPLLDLPGVFGTTLENLPALVPYLTAQSDRVERWRKRLMPFEGFKVGIAWQGDRRHAADQRRSIPLAALAPSGAIDGVRLFSLQKGDGAEQLAQAARPPAIEDLGPQLDNDGGAFMDTAAVMKNLDLVVTSDTAIAHLAGALGVNVWVALSAVPDWRWLSDRRDSPWYPTMRLFRQARRGDWPEVFARIAQELRSAISQRW